MRGKRGVALAAMLAAFGLTVAEAQAQGLHGIRIAKGCAGPICDGETTDCTIEFGYNDDFGDTIRVLEAYDVADYGGDNVRVPDTGNLPIVVVGGNTTCTVGGSLPCEIGPGGSTLSGLPGDPDPGFIRFRQNTYVVQENDAAPLADQATVIWEDLCDDPETSGCGAGITNQAPAPASTPIARCNDGDDCTNDSCEAGVCTNDPIICDDDNLCTSDACVGGICVFTTDVECNDDNACTDDTCDPATGECVFTDNYDCNDDNACTDDTCDPATGECVFTDNYDCNDDSLCTDDSCDPATGECVFTPNYDCDDGDACTEDSCDPATGACVHSDPPDCDDGDACTEDSCDPATGECVHSDPPPCDDGDACTEDSCDPATGECVHSDPRDCDDQNACTIDSCDSATGECINEPDTSIVCDDNNMCTMDSCDPATGECVFEPNQKIDCNDNDDCTEDRCVPETGLCENMPIEPPPPGCAEFAGCTPGFWKQPQHLQYWVAYTPDQLFEDVFGVDAIILDGKTLREAMWTGGGGEAALGRHCVAALLNSSNPEVDYAYSTDAIIAMVQDAYATGDFQHAKNLLAEQNELGCTVDTSNKNPGREGRRGRGDR